MRIKVVSDLHLEFSDINIANDNDYDVLILSGDVLVANKVARPNSEAGQRFRNFLQRVSFQFPYVIYVAGNHEFYNGGHFFGGLAQLELTCLEFPNIYFLENNVKEIQDVMFVGGTLWSDMNKYDPLTMQYISGMMNDYRAIRHDYDGYRTIRPKDTVERHAKTRDYIFEKVDQNPDKKIVVVTHHSPSFESCHEYYKHDIHMNGAYHSELSELIIDRPQIKLWTHGHTHHPFDYKIGECRVICNPRGYEDGHYSENTGWNPNILIEV